MKSKKGLLLPIIAAIALCLALLGLGVLQLGFDSRIMATKTIASISARAAADTGITHALYEINGNFTIGDNPLLTPRPPDVSDQTMSNSDATYSYKIRGPLIEPAIPEPYWIIESVGKLGSQERYVYATMTVRNLFDYGLIVTDSIDLKNDTLVDGYDSQMGLYSYRDTLPDGSINAFRNVKIGTTYGGSDPRIILRNNVTVTGQVLVGIGGSAEEGVIIDERPDGGATTGGYGVLPEAWLWNLDLLNVTVPSGISSGSISAADFTDSALVVGSADTLTYLRYGSINIPNASSLIFRGQVEIHVTGDIRIGTNGQLFVGDPSAPTPPVTPDSLIIYLDGDLDAGNSNGINNLSRVPANFRLFGTGSDQLWNIKNGGDFYGTYYGPNADIRIFAKGEVFGSVSGKNFELKSDPGTNYGLHYDTALSNLSGYDIGFGIDRVWESAR